MKKTQNEYQSYLRILREELIPAMGCTEPIALAYCAARCRDLLGGIPERISVSVSGSIVKNVKSVIVPNTGELKGIEAAVIAGVAAGKAEKKLEVISSVTDEQKEAMKAYLHSIPVAVRLLESDLNFDIRMEMSAGTNTACVRIADYHTNIVHEEKDGRVLLDIPAAGPAGEGITDRSILNMHDIWDFAESCSIDDVREIIGPQIRYNMAIAEKGMAGQYGADIGRVMLDAYGDTILNKAVAMAAAASDARMGGCEMPVIINSGSGNQGIACSVPVIVYAEGSGAGEEKLCRALVLSNLITIHEKTGIGRLSAFCGAVCAGIAAGAGIAYLKGGDYNVIEHTVVNGLAIVSGMVCDGAKASCAAKIACSVKAGIFGYEMFVRGHEFLSGDGLVTKGSDNTIRNIGRLGREGVKETNSEIIDIMIKNGC